MLSGHLTLVHLKFGQQIEQSGHADDRRIVISQCNILPVAANV
jgi:hypothetical protein